MNLELITKQVVNLSRAVGQFIQSQLSVISSADIEEKGMHDLVTFVDKEAEARLVSELKKILPEAGFICEENKSLLPSDDLNWIIDPLDGTTNFIHGIPIFAVSVALASQNELLSGVVYEVNQKECFYAWKGSKAFLNGKEIRVSPTGKLTHALIATGFPYYNYSLMKPWLGVFEDMMRNSRGVRRIGSAAVDLAYVACGRFDLFFEYSLHSWDVAAGSLIVKQAGGQVTDFNNVPKLIADEHIIASNSIIHKEFMVSVSKHFGIL